MMLLGILLFSFGLFSSVIAFDGSETLSPRSVNTKYGSLRGIIVYFKTYDRNYVSGVPGKPGSSSSSSSSSSSGTSSSSSSGSGGTSGQTKSASLPPLKPVEVFLGVPYATPPVGSLRFMPPVTPAHWRGVKLANRFGPVCPQKPPEINLWSDNGRTNQTNGKSSFGGTNINSNININNNSGGGKNYGSKNQLPDGRVSYLKRIMPFLRNQSEDCLYLNIYAPFTQGSTGSSSSSSRLPVVVFIHGESYDWGAGNPYDGTILASFGNVIIVTVNYRLGIFGFLPAFDGASIRGNFGLMDQVAALHWIQENIAEFGGDSHNVTIIGHGYGAACVNLLMISPMASNLFSRVILMSGSALSPWAIAHDAETYARNLAKVLNCPNYDNVVMVECLRSKSIEEILRVDLKVPEHLTSFGPIIDGIVVPLEPKLLINKAVEQSSSSFPSSQSSSSSSSSSSGSSSSSSSSGSSLFSSPPPLYASPVVYDRSGHATSINSYDLLFGIARVETPFVFTGTEEKHGIDLSRRDRILRTLVRNLFDYHQQVIFLTLINEYTDWSRPVEHPINLFDSLVDILGDALIVSPLIQTGDCNTRLSSTTSSLSSSRRHHHIPSGNPRSQAASQTVLNRPSESGTRTFFYVFSYQSENNGFAQRLGCHHGEELPYVFGAPLAQDLIGRSIGHFQVNSSKQEITLSEAVMTYWINFVKFGDPNIWPHELDALGDRAKGRFENVYWPQYDTTQRKYLMIAMKPKVRDHYHSHRLSYWLQLLPKLQHQPDNEEQLYYYKHHLLPDHENPETYDGIVRQISFRFLSSAMGTTPSSSFGVGNPGFNLSAGFDQRPMKADSTFLNRQGTSSSNQQPPSSSSRNSTQAITTVVNKPEETSSSSSSSSTAPTDQGASTETNKTQATPIIMEQSSYSTALSVTIAIGCSLLILNMLIFAGVYYQLDKAKVGRGKSPHGQQHRHTSYEQDQRFHEKPLSREEAMMLSPPRRSSYIIAGSGGLKPLADHEIGPSSPGSAIMTGNENNEAIYRHYHPESQYHTHYIQTEEQQQHQQQQQQQLQNQQQQKLLQQYQQQGLLQTNFDDNCQKSDYGSVLVTTLPKERVICNTNSLRRSPKAPLSSKRPSITTGGECVGNFLQSNSPTHHQRCLNGCCPEECLPSQESGTTNSTGTLGRNYHHHSHQVTFNPRNVVTEVINKQQSNILSNNQDETVA